MKRYIKADTNSNLFEKYYILQDLQNIGNSYGVNFKVVSDTSGEYAITRDDIPSVLTINIAEKPYKKLEINYSVQIGNLIKVNDTSQEELEKIVKNLNLGYYKSENSFPCTILQDIVEALYYSFEYYLDMQGKL